MPPSNPPIYSDDGLRAKIPVYSSGDTIAAYATVDAVDAPTISAWRWILAPDGYVRRVQNEDGKRITILMHRQLLGLTYGDPRRPDHRDRDRLNNQRANLRIIPHSGNMQNKRSYRGSSSQYRGVAWHKGSSKWAAYVQVDGRMHWLGRFRDEIEAARIAREARSRLMPFALD